MKIYLSLDDLPTLSEPVCLTIGNFDGVHFGHHTLLSKLKAHDQHTAVLTFTNHPSEVLKNKPSPPFLSDPFIKFSLMEVHGIDTLISVPFTRELAQLTYSEFLDKISAKMAISRLVLGENEAFGKNREGTPDAVSLYAKTRGIETDYILKKNIDGQIVSSSLIRTLIQKGDLLSAEKLLGRPYLFSIPAHKKRIDVSPLCLPPDGTYPFFSEEGKPLTIQIETTSQGRFLLLPNGHSNPTIIASRVIEEFYIERAAQRIPGPPEPDQASELSGCSEELAAPYRSGESPSFEERDLQKPPKI